MSEDALKEILGDLQKVDPSITMLSDPNSSCMVDNWISTGCTILDLIMGGGLPVGRIIECYGDESTGKSLLAAQVAATAQEDGHVVIYIDTESAISIDIMRAVGVDPDKMIYIVLETMEDVFTVMEKAMDSMKERAEDKTLVIIWDSIAATSTKSEVDDDYGSSPMAAHARMMSQGLRKIAKRIAKENACAFFLNQTREKIGVMFGDKKDTFGGKALKFYASIRMRLAYSGRIKEGTKVVGVNTRVDITKNKVAIPFRQAELPIYFGEGVNDAESMFLYLKKHELVKTAGGWHELDLLDPETHRPIELGRFRQKGFVDIFEEHFDTIVDLVVEDMGDISIVVDEEKESEENVADN